MSLWIYKKGKDGKRSLYWVTDFTFLIIIVLGLLAALVAPRMFGKVEKDKQKTAHAQIVLLIQALESFKEDTGRYPETLEGLDALINTPDIDGWKGPYLQRATLPKDPWNRSYYYRSPGDYGHYDIWSYGADGLQGGEGKNKDISTWEYEKEE
jgi:general secretion pathway protein G